MELRQKRQCTVSPSSNYVCTYYKVTIHPEFFGIVPNFEGLSRQNTRSFRTLNCPKFRTLSRICPDLMSRCVAVQAVDQNAKCKIDHFDVFAYQRCVLLSSKCTKSIFGWGSASDPAGEVYDAPPNSLVGWGKRCPLLILSLLLSEVEQSNSIAEIETRKSHGSVPRDIRDLRRLDLGVAAASKSVPNFHH